MVSVNWARAARSALVVMVQRLAAAQDGFSRTVAKTWRRPLPEMVAKA